MEHSVSSLAFKGSIPEAIVEAKRHKKLFVVYISGDNADSVHLDKSTWLDLNVAESLSKYCILLHISEGSTDAAQFSALYPQKSAPCITAIGYNGVQLWQNEGLITAEDLALSLEKAWLSLHVQETTATFLTAALASRRSDQLPSGASHISSLELGSSSAADAPSSSTDNHVNTSEARTYSDLDTEESKQCEHPVEEINPKLGDEDKVSHTSSVADKLKKVNVEQPAPSTDTVRESGMTSSNNSRVDHMSGCSNSEENLTVARQQLRDNVEAPQTIADEARELVKPKPAESSEIEKADILDLSANIPSDVHLNIRVPGGISLQEKFPLTSTLRLVKDYVDEKKENSIGSYDLAVPYPRKVFNDQDLGKTLSELGLLNRQALILVPHHRAVSHHKGGSFLSNQTTSTNDIDSSNGSSEGYFSFVRRILSYVNPFSYLGGATTSSSSSVQEPQSSTQQHGASSAPQGNFTGSRRSYLVSPNQNAPANGRNNTNNTQQTSSRFGSNIHTLKHDEDDSNFSGRNAFWNGNSTEYGGDSDNK